MSSKFLRKRIRLDASVYNDEGRIFSVTVGTAPRRSVFADLDFGEECVGILSDLRQRKNFSVFAYCLMPDHAHLLIGNPDGGSLSQFVGAWKSLCYRARRLRGHHDRFWQRSFFDRALRRGTDLKDSALYILANPVRAGLAKTYLEYPLCGSLDLDL